MPIKSFKHVTKISRTTILAHNSGCKKLLKSETEANKGELIVKRQGNKSMMAMDFINQYTRIFF